MRRSLLVLPLLAALVGASALTAAAAPAAESAQGYIVTLRADVSSQDVANEHARNYGAAVSHVYSYALSGYAARMSAATAARVARDSRVLAVEADLPVSIERKPGSGSPPPQPAQSVPTGIARIGGPVVGPVDVDVAVIDTGIQPDHPDLNVVGGKNCQSGSSWADGHGHGTHVAGTIAAIGNTIGVIGVAPGARLWAVRVLNNRGSGTTSSVLCGVDWVTSMAGTIEVANMSIGGSGSDPADGQVGNCSTGSAYHDSVCRAVAAGVTIAVAAGNSAANAATSVPAAFDDVITVSALADSDGLSGGGTWPSTACRADQEDTLADFSNYGADVDLIAPGVCILSTYKGSAYATMSGTSMASPHVAGAAAVYAAAHPGATPAQVKAALQAAGGLDWTGDVDATKEPLLHLPA